MNAFLKPLDLDPARLSNLTISFSKVLTELARDSDDQMLPTPAVLPAGNSSPYDGLLLAIDVGGSHLRVSLFESMGIELDMVFGDQYQVIPEEIKSGTAEGLFDFIGRRIVDVIKFFARTSSFASSKRLPLILPVGITFSFPMIQTSLSEAILMPLGKGFTMHPGQKLDMLLVDGYNRAVNSGSSSMPSLCIKAITNDTIATMIAGTKFAKMSSTLSTHAYTDVSDYSGEVAMGLIMATGMNASVAMPISAFSAKKTASITLDTAAKSEPRLLTNTEWSIRGTSLPLRELGLITKWDKKLDANTAAPGFQPLEYMTSGRYMGELVRIILMDYLMNVANIVEEDVPPSLLQKNAITTEYLSTVVATAKSASKLAGQLHVDFPCAPWSTFTWTANTAEVLITIAQRVQIRSSRLLAAASIGLLLCSGDLALKTSRQPPPRKKDMSPHEVTIAVSGAMIEKYPMYLATCQETIDALFFSLCRNEDGVERVVLRIVEEGGLRGAAILAAGQP